MRLRYVLFALALLALVSCGAAPGDVENGRKLYMGEVPIANGNAPACVMCHPVNPGEAAQVMGQNLSNIGLRAGRSVPGQSAEAYLRTAILDPDSYLAGGFQEGVMYRDYRKALSEQQIRDLVAYMLTLKSGQD